MLDLYNRGMIWRSAAVIDILLLGALFSLVLALAEAGARHVRVSETLVAAIALGCYGCGLTIKFWFRIQLAYRRPVWSTLPVTLAVMSAAFFGANTLSVAVGGDKTRFATGPLLAGLAWGTLLYLAFKGEVSAAPLRSQDPEPDR